MKARRAITAVVLAGGQGTRIRRLLPDLPKPMAPVRGRPFLDWVARFLALQGIEKIIIATGYKAEVIEAYFRSERVPNAEVACVRENEPLGTAGGFLEAIAQAPTPEAWLVCNGDSLALTSFEPLFQALSENQVDGALLGVPMTDASNYGTLEFDDDHLLRRFAEKRPGGGLINAGVYLLKSGLCSTFPARRPLSFETDVFPFLLSAGTRLQVVPAAGPFLDIGTPETFLQKEAFIEGLTKSHAPMEDDQPS